MVAAVPDFLKRFVSDSGHDDLGAFGSVADWQDKSLAIGDWRLNTGSALGAVHGTGICAKGEFVDR
jgi:hypothetical protein